MKLTIEIPYSWESVVYVGNSNNLSFLQQVMTKITQCVSIL